MIVTRPIPVSALARRYRGARTARRYRRSSFARLDVGAQGLWLSRSIECRKLLDVSGDAAGCFAAHGFFAVGVWTAAGDWAVWLAGVFAAQGFWAFWLGGAQGFACCASAGATAANVIAPTIVTVVSVLIACPSSRLDNPRSSCSIPEARDRHRASVSRGATCAISGGR
jgi:hypothetical protein